VTPLLSTALLRTQADARLVLLAGSGNEQAFEEIVARYRRPLQRYCERALPRAQAEDVVQQVLTKAWVALQNGTQVRHLKPWLYRIAQTTALESAEKPGYDYAQLEQSLRPASPEESELEQRAVIRRTLTGLASLPPAQREALLRAAVHGQSRAEIAAALGVSEGAVRQLLHRARSSLRAAATAITPLPLLNWATSVGPADPAVAGAAGVVGLAKASAVVASAGVLVATPAAVQHARRDSPQNHRPKPAVRAAKPVQRVSSFQPAAVVRAAETKSSPSGLSEHTDDEHDGRQEQSGEDHEAQHAHRDNREQETEVVRTALVAKSEGEQGEHAEDGAKPTDHEVDQPGHGDEGGGGQAQAQAQADEE
jgi:RNA polymerase sigma factor (sigma-70 family)